MMPLDANPMGNVYGGSIMKYLDEVAAVSAKRLTRSNVVTASIERMDFQEAVHIGDLLIFKSAVIWTGRTSMIVGCKVLAEHFETGHVAEAGTCYLTFVALDGSGRPTPVPGVEPANDEERRWTERGRELYELGKAHKAAKKAAR